MYVGDAACLQLLRQQTLRQAALAADCVLPNVDQHRHARLDQSVDELIDAAAFVADRHDGRGTRQLVRGPEGNICRLGEIGERVTLGAEYADQPVALDLRPVQPLRRFPKGIKGVSYRRILRLSETENERESARKWELRIEHPRPPVDTQLGPINDGIVVSRLLHHTHPPNRLIDPRRPY